MSDPVEIAAEALRDTHSDLSECSYYQGVGTCWFGCYDEPQCHTSIPEGGWPRENLRRKYPDLIREDGFGEPTTEDRIDAVAVLHALDENGWRIVKTTGAIEDDIAIAEEWTP